MCLLYSRFPYAMDTDLSSQDRKDLDKFIKFFALKVISVVVFVVLLSLILHLYCKSQNSLCSYSDDKYRI